VRSLSGLLCDQPTLWPPQTGIVLPQDSLLKHGCVALLAEKLGSPDVDMRIAAAWSLANLAYSASDAARSALLTQLPAATVVTALHDQHSSVQVRARSCLQAKDDVCRESIPAALKASRMPSYPAPFAGTCGADSGVGNTLHIAADTDTSPVDASLGAFVG